MIKKFLKSLNPWALILGLGFFSVASYFGGNPFSKIASASDWTFFALSQLCGVGSMMIGFDANTQKSAKKKLIRLTLGTGVNILQFGFLVAAGMHTAMAGMVQHIFATFRTGFFASMIDPAKNDSRLSRNARTACALGFVGLATAFMLTGFGFSAPLAPIGKLAHGDFVAIFMMLPMAGSLCSAKGDSMQRVRYIRPFRMASSVLNCAYNGFLGTAAIKYIIGECGHILIHSHQIATIDTPPKNFMGKKLTLGQRIRGYFYLMKRPKLADTYYLDKQKEYREKH